MLRRSGEGEEEEEPEMKRSKEKTSLGRVLGKRLEQIFCHDSALALLRYIPRYSNIVLAIFFRTMTRRMPYSVLQRHLHFQEITKLWLGD